MRTTSRYSSAGTEYRGLPASQDGDSPQIVKLQALTAALSEARLPADVARVVADEMKAVLGADQGVLATVSDDGQELALLGHSGMAPENVVEYGRISVDIDLPVVRAFRTGEGVWVDSRQQFLREFASAPDAEPRAQAVACAPLALNGSIIGAVGFAFFAPRPFTPADRALVQDVATQAALALERAHLYEREQQARQRAEQLYRFANAAVQAERLEQVFDAALEAIAQGLGTGRSSILTYDPDGVMRFRASRGLSDAYRRAVEGHSPWTRETVSPPPVLVHDVERDATLAEFVPVFRAEGVRGLGFFPLLAAGRLQGKFMVYYDRPHPFAPHEIEFATAIGNHLATVIGRFTAVAELQETIRLNETFAGVMAHDLRNPLSAVMTTAKLLLQRQAGEGERITSPLNRILSSGDRMLRMIEQLLDFTRIRVGGGMDIEPRTTSLVDLCTQAIGELELANPSWDIRWNARGDVTGSWDSDRLLQVVSNLVANAGQHGTPNTPVLVSVDGAGESIVLEIRNQGAIPENLFPHLFDPFRGTRGATRSRGLGLGLFIVREIVEAHGGRVDIRSSATEDTRVRVTLPRTSLRAAQARTTI